jgi:ribosome-binding protein aMBF1 (putative translation factor)
VPRATTKKSARPWRSEARSDPETLRTFRKLGERIRALRGQRKLTQEQLAERAALSVQHLLDLEHGRSNPTLASLIGIARGLDVSLPELFR